LLRRAIAAIHIILGIAVWRAKEAQFGARELLGNHHRSSQQAGWSWGCVSAIDSNWRTVLLQTRIAMTENVSLCMRMKS
jgi:hypothetical protein